MRHQRMGSHGQHLRGTGRSSVLRHRWTQAGLTLDGSDSAGLGRADRSGSSSWGISTAAVEQSASARREASAHAPAGRFPERAAATCQNR